MSTSVLPTLPGLTYSVMRSPVWKTRIQQNISGKETRIADFSTPRYKWEVIYNFLRQGTVNNVAQTEMQQLFGFFNQRQGSYDSFLYQDPYDNTVLAANAVCPILANGVTTVFPLVRTFGGGTDYILAPNLAATFNVRLNGTIQSAGLYTALPWGTGNVNGPGNVVFGSPPSSGTISFDFSYYWPVRFDSDECQFEEFMHGYWKVKKLAFTSIK